jgi:hypothetical protein
MAARCRYNQKQANRCGAAFFVALCIVADDPDRQVARRLEQHLTAKHPAIAIIDVAARDHVFQEAVTLHPDAVQAGGNGFGEAAGGIGFRAAEVIVSDAQFAADFGPELRLGGDDRDQARRCVAAEQRSLRAPQYLDPVDRAELGQTDARTRAIDAVDEHGDRAFEARVVTDRADAADVCSSSAGFRRGGENQQGWAELGQGTDVASARVLKGLGRDGGNGERNVRQGFVTPRRRDDNLAGVLIGGIDLDILVVDGGRLGGCALRGLGSARIGIRFLGISRHRERDQASREQPHRLAHLNPPRFEFCSLGERINRVGGGCKANAFKVERKTADLRQKCHISQRSIKKARLP